MIGLDKFKEYFMGYQDQYVLIGGARDEKSRTFSSNPKRRCV